MELTLTPAEMKQFTNALVSAFTRNELEQVVLFGLGEGLDNIVKPAPFGKMVADLVVWANQKGESERLLTEARRENPGNVQLQQFESQMRTRTAPEPTTPKPTKSNAALELWRQRLAFFEEQEAIAAGADKKFELRHQIDEAKRKIEELGG